MDEGGAPDQEQPQPPPQPPPGPRARAEHLLAGRPLMVYVVLAAGVLVLVILLAIVWFSATGNHNKNTEACLTIKTQDAYDAIKSGTVDRIDVVVNQDDPQSFPILLKFTMRNGRCYNGPQGAGSANDNYLLLGKAYFFNATTSKNQQISIHEQKQVVPPEALQSPTPTQTPSPIVVTATPIPTRPAVGTPLPPPVPTATATATVTPTMTPLLASPAAAGTPATPVASPATP